ncbi:MAG: 50S ribosomal protein L11 methyltransferase [Rhizobiaceae bacterium]|nr:50S ribosomal protein L11 methyltransferase [Rhizobiaceae bacterium]
MTQHHHSLQANQTQVRKIFDLFDAEFEEDGLPVSSYEIDEKIDLWGISVYTDEHITQLTKTRMTKVLNDNGIDVDINSEIIDDTDWVAKTLRQLNPVRAGRFLIHGSHDKHAARFNDTAINIDAGLAFGTGHHGTTAGCLDMLGVQLKRRKFANILDLGTGSGILAIAAAKATKQRVLASDIDPVATNVARQNARNNGVGNLLTCITAKGFKHREITARAPYDLIIANILARPLQSMARDFALHLAPNATIILSGLLPHQKARIVASFRIQKMYFAKAHIRDGWLTLVLRAK